MSNTVVMTSDELADLIRRMYRKDGWLTLKEAAARVRTSIRTMESWVASGRLAAYAPGHTRLVSVRELDKIVNRSLVVPGEKSERGKKGTATLEEHRAARQAKREAERSAAENAQPEEPWMPEGAQGTEGTETMETAETNQEETVA